MTDCLLAGIDALTIAWYQFQPHCIAPRVKPREDTVCGAIGADARPN